MHEDGSLDGDGQAALAATVAAAGARTVVALDLAAGEAASVDPDERDRVVAAVRHGAAGVPVAVGLGPPGTGTLQAAHRAAASGGQVLVAAVPAAAGRREELAAVASLGLPLWLHHHPALTGASLSADELVALAADLDAAAVIVEAAPSPDPVAAVAASGGPLVAIGALGGLFLLEELEAGAQGTTACPPAIERTVALVEAGLADEAAGAREAFLELAGYLRLEAGSPGVRVRKEGWRQRGVLTSGRVRRGAPLGAATKRAITRRLRETGLELREPYPGA